MQSSFEHQFFQLLKTNRQETVLYDHKIFVMKSDTVKEQPDQNVSVKQQGENHQSKVRQKNSIPQPEDKYKRPNYLLRLL